jgi:hypothetical protein
VEEEEDQRDLVQAAQVLLLERRHLAGEREVLGDLHGPSLGTHEWLLTAILGKGLAGRYAQSHSRGATPLQRQLTTAN